MKLSYFIPLLLLAVSSVSQNNLRLYTGSDEPFTVFTGDSTVNKKPEVDVLIENIVNDTIKVNIEFANKLKGSAVLYLLEKREPVKNKEFKYLLETKNNKVKFTFAGTEDILPLPSPLVPVKPAVDTSYKLRNNVLGHYCELKEGKAIYFNNLPKAGECVTPMPGAYINYMNSMMLRAHVDDDKYTIAENTCLNNCISVSQLNKMLSYIIYELEKLKLVKLAYFHITDKENRNRLDSTFKLESSKKELAYFFKNSNDYKLSSGNNCVKASSEAEIAELCKSLSIYSNDSERFNAFKKTYANLCYTSGQIKLILNQYVHDREKLDAARLLYYHCTDKENFLNIIDVFSYTTTAAELKDFVSKQKN
ncbi:MAG: DUF4476 domain-containing protein [Bacteroidia bacterium]